MNKLTHHLRNHAELWLLGVLAMATRLWDIGTPNAVVFDEVYFKSFASSYLSGHYYFDIHPPLAKLLIAGCAWLGKISATTLVTQPAVTLRLLPAIAGAALVLIIYGITMELSSSRLAASFAAALVLLDNALVVESRFILTDSMLLASSFAAVYCWLKFRKSPTRSPNKWLWATMTAVLLGVSISIKWTGLANFGLIVLAMSFDLYGKHKRKVALDLRYCLVVLLLPFVIYIATFWVHFHLLPKSGSGDAFMSAKFQSTLVGNSNYQANKSMSFWAKTIELNLEMYRASATLTATHPYGSAWYTWPLELRPVYYYQGTTMPDGRQSNIYLLGNPAIWWGLTAAIIAILLFVNISWVKFLRPIRYGLAMSVVAYAANYLPFVGVPRVMFLYHYFFAFIWSIIFVTLVASARMDWKAWRWPRSFRAITSKQWAFAAVTVLIACSFIYLMPLTYGLPMTTNQLSSHFWLPSWR